MEQYQSMHSKKHTQELKAETSFCQVLFLEESASWSQTKPSTSKSSFQGHKVPFAPPQEVQEMMRFIEIIDRSYLGLQDLSFSLLKYFTRYLEAQAARIILPDTRGGLLGIPKTQVVYPYDDPHYFLDISQSWQETEGELFQKGFVNHLGKDEVMVSYPLMYRGSKLCQIDFICSQWLPEVHKNFLNRVSGELALRISKEITLERSFQQKRILNQQLQRIVRQQRSLNNQIINIIQISKNLCTKYSA